MTARAPSPECRLRRLERAFRAFLSDGRAIMPRRGWTRLKRALLDRFGEDAPHLAPPLEAGAGADLADDATAKTDESPPL